MRRRLLGTSEKLMGRRRRGRVLREQDICLFISERPNWPTANELGVSRVISEQWETPTLLRASEVKHFWRAIRLALRST
jgi:hypothetical protein